MIKGSEINKEGMTMRKSSNQAQQDQCIQSIQMLIEIIAKKIALGF